MEQVSVHLFEDVSPTITRQESARPWLEKSRRGWGLWFGCLSLSGTGSEFLQTLSKRKEYCGFLDAKAQPHQS